ncbi:MAG TPA: hypothetical protein VGC92_05825 [Phenylobacterium sp.]
MPRPPGAPDRPETAALRAVLSAKPGAEASPAVRGVTLYKVMGKSSPSWRTTGSSA